MLGGLLSPERQARFLSESQNLVDFCGEMLTVVMEHLDTDGNLLPTPAVHDGKIISSPASHKVGTISSPSTAGPQIVLNFTAPKIKTFSSSVAPDTKVVSGPTIGLTSIGSTPLLHSKSTVSSLASFEAAEVVYEKNSIAHESSLNNTEHKVTDTEPSSTSTMSDTNHCSSSTTTSHKDDTVMATAVYDTAKTTHGKASTAQDALLTNMDHNATNLNGSSSITVSEPNFYSSITSASSEDITTKSHAANDAASISLKTGGVALEASLTNDEDETTNDETMSSTTMSDSYDPSDDPSSHLYISKDPSKWSCMASDQFQKHHRQTLPSKRTALAQQYASYEDPARFDITHVLKQAVVRDYRFDSNSSCAVIKNGEHIDYRNAKDEDGWDIVDPKGVENLKRELAMAHDSNGNWKAIDDWDGRPGFISDSNHYQNALAWMEERVNEALNDPIDYNTSDPLYTAGKAASAGEDIFLLYPILDEVHETIPADDPFTLHPENYNKTAFKASQVVTKALREEKEKIRALNKQKREARILFNKSAKEYVPPPNLYIPKINMYVRPAMERDMQQISDIYNYHVKEGPVSPDVTTTTRDDWLARWRLTKGEQSLPFVVGICKSQRTSSYSRQKRRYDTLPEENVVGFSWAEDYMGKRTAYDGTVQVHAYVHPSHKHMGIGKNMLDRIMAAIDRGHLPRNGCKYKDKEEFDDAPGSLPKAMRTAERILVNVPFYPGKEEALTWLKKWLWTEFYFDEVATIPNMGVKNGEKWVLFPSWRYRLLLTGY